MHANFCSIAATCPRGRPLDQTVHVAAALSSCRAARGRIGSPAPQPLATHRWAYDDTALAALCKAVARTAPGLVVMEATGGLQRHAAAELAACGVTVAVVNPRQGRSFARACGELPKTDAVRRTHMRAFGRAAEPAPPVGGHHARARA